MTSSNDRAVFLPGRKQERQTSADEAWQVLASPGVQYGLLGTHGLREEGGFPYVVPMNFAADRDQDALYLHSTNEAASKRCRAIQEDARVSFTVVDPASAIVPDPQGRPCKFTMRYRSVMVLGHIEAVASDDEKARLLNFMMQQKAPAARLDKVQPADVAGVAVWILRVKHLSGKRGG